MIEYIIDFMQGQASFIELFVYISSMCFVVFCATPLHEFAHALAAVKLGDSTPRLQGRLTINPIAHIDPIGAIMIFLFGFGYAKPVSVYMHNFKKPKVGMAIVALAGPVSNLIQTFICLTLYVFIGYFNTSGNMLLSYVELFFNFAAVININLAVFNLIPIPPLDGSRIATALIPDRIYYKLMQFERYFTIILFVLLSTGILSTPLSFISNGVITIMVKIITLPFMFIG